MLAQRPYDDPIAFVHWSNYRLGLLINVAYSGCYLAHDAFFFTATITKLRHLMPLPLFTTRPNIQRRQCTHY